MKTKITGSYQTCGWLDEKHLYYETLDDCFLPKPGKRLRITWEGEEREAACVRNERHVAQDGKTPIYRSVLLVLQPVARSAAR